MKKVVLIIVALLFNEVSFAQRITVSGGTEKFNDSFQPSFEVFIPHTTTKTALREWSDFLKDHRAKVKTSGDELTGSNAVIPAISKDTLTAYGKVLQRADGVSLIVAFENPYGFISESGNPVEAQTILRILHDLALPLAKDGLKDKISIASKALDSKTKEMEELEKRNVRLHAENEKMQNQIHDNEREIKDNQQKITASKSNVSTAKESLDNVKLKEKELE
jgi:hypothetical protein